MIPGIPNPTYSATVGSITTHPHYCDWCHKQYASKAKLLQHQRKKHPEQMAIINTNARNRQRLASASSSSLPPQVMTPSPQNISTQVITSQTENLMSSPNTSANTSPSGVSLGPSLGPNLITILGNLNSIITATMNNDLSQTNATTAEIQELLQGSSGDLLTQAMSELTANKGDGATLIITTQSSEEVENWSQVCGEIA